MLCRNLFRDALDVAGFYSRSTSTLALEDSPRQGCVPERAGIVAVVGLPLMEPEILDAIPTEPMVLDASAFEPPPDAVDFYSDSLRLLKESGIPHLLSGTYALSCFTGLVRPTKDLDVFCKASDAPRILAFFKAEGYEITMEDERWIGKVWRTEHFFDVIFNISSASIPITDDWFRDTWEVEVYGTRVRITPPTEFILSKLFIQDRYRYDGADVAHVILKQHDRIDWRRLLSSMELHWEVLLIHLLNFRFIYPTKRDHVPRWLFDELIDRIRAQAELPAAGIDICRGRLLSPRDYVTDIGEWGFADVVGKGLEERHERKF